MNIAIISFGVGGTKGHMTLITHMANELVGEGLPVFIFSEENYKDTTNVKNDNIKYENIPHQEHRFTTAGDFEYDYVDDLIAKIESNAIECIIFSTFFNKEVIKYAKSKGIKCVLVSYPLRDSHREAFFVREYYKLFDKIVTLGDIYPLIRTFPNEVFARSPNVEPFIKNEVSTTSTRNVKNILVTCGGGGRPSAVRFFDIIESVIPRILENNKEIRFTIIMGNCKRDIRCSGVEVLDWSNNFVDLVRDSDLIISEAGFFTVMELLANKKPSILIPGDRRIDNQELRAVSFEREGCGLFMIPEERDQYLFDLINKVLDGKQLDKMSLSCGKAFEEIKNLSSLKNILMESIK